MSRDLSSLEKNDKKVQLIPSSMSRRSFLQRSALLTAGCMIPTSLTAGVTRHRHLSFYHTHTGEWLEIDYYPGKYSGAIRQEFETFLRDFRTGDVHTIDPGLLDILFRIQKSCGSSGVYEVISGYRSPRTNEFLRRTGSGVEEKSLHMEGQAIDIRLTDRPISLIRDIALNIHNGGVGYYPQSDFVHIDTGIRRNW